MKHTVSIPEVQFPYRHSKSFDFEIVSNREILLDQLPTDHDPFWPHRLHFYAILFIREGEGDHFIDFKKYQYTPRSIIFIAKDQVHAFEKNMEREASFMLFTQNFLERSSAGSNLMQQLSLYNYSLNHPILKLGDENFELLSNLVSRIETEYHASNDFATEEIIQSALKIFLLTADRIRKKTISEQPKLAYRDEFLQFQKLLKKHLLETRRVNFYADQMLISAKKLNMVTKEIVHLPTKTYINEMLILEIKRFLMNTALSVKEIAYKTGFEEPTNFVKFFKKYACQTPAEFRKSF